MTAAEMLVYFRERYNLSSHTNLGKFDDELYLYLNAAVNFFVNTRFTGNNSRQANIDNDQKRNDDLRTLFTKSGSLGTGNTPEYYTNSKSFALPSDYRFLVNCFTQIDNAWLPCDMIAEKEAKDFAKTKFNLPTLENPKAFTHNNEITILYDSDSSINTGVCVIDYIKSPTPISAGVPCNLPEHTHEEIVELAVLIATDSSENLEKYRSVSDIIDKRTE